jgi:putative ABC transport system permease protein
MTRAWLRIWKRSPLLTAQFAITIAVGMGAVAAVVSLMLALGYQPLPFRDPGQLVTVWERLDAGSGFTGISGPDLTDFAQATQNIFTSLGGFVNSSGLPLQDSRGTVKVRFCLIQASALDEIGIRPLLGRSVRLDDETIYSGGRIPLWISYRLWRSRYGGSSSVIGTQVALGGLRDSISGVIVGVFPPRVVVPFPYGENVADVWYLFERDISTRPRAGSLFLALGRLRPGVTIEQAQAALTVVQQRIAQTYSYDRHKVPVVQGFEEIAQGPARQTMGLMALGVGLVFLVACVNLAILMGVEGRRRRREIAIRAVLGAARSRLWLEVAAEKCVLTVLSLAFGAWFAAMLLRLLSWLVPSAGLGAALDYVPPLNLGVLSGFAAFALAAALVWSALLVAAADGPATSRALASSGGLGYTGLSDSGRDAGRWRLVLLTAQAGTGICLLAAAALAAKTYSTLSVANLGPSPRHTVLLSLISPDNVMSLSDPQLVNFSQQVISRLERLPGTQAVAVSDYFPPHGSPGFFLKPGDSAEAARGISWPPLSVSPGYFRTLGIPILFGRGFDDSDKIGSEPAAIISMDMAEQNWTSPEQAVGSQIALGRKFEKPYKIVGVVANFTGYWSQKPLQTVYLPEAQSADFCDTIILRTSGSATTIAALAKQALAGTSIPANVEEVSTMQARWQATLTRPLARMAGMLLLAMLGLALSVQGVYAVAAASVASRRRELAVRSALGANPGHLAWNVTRGLVLAVVVGSAIGIAAALDLRSVLQHWLGPKAVWQVEPLFAAVLLLVVAAAAGCYFPARSATRANPADVLRQG